MRSRTYTPASTLLFLALLLLPLGPAQLFAQQAPDQGQYAPNQPLPDQRSDYGQSQPEGQLSPQYPPQSYPDPGAMNPQPGNSPIEPLRAQELQQLVAPIALYPDTLVAQVLTAATYPAQVADADRWRRMQGYASSDQIAAGADAQPWDPSVKALTAFPQVLAQMNYNLQWTTQLGNAYYNQPQDLLEAVQVMRQRAQSAGNLRSTPQESVNYDQGNIVLAPASPEVVYVPVYNPWAVYGQPVASYPGFSLLGALGSFIGSSVGPLAVRFGLGIATTAFMHTPFGLLAWGLDWLAHAVLFHGSNYYSHSSTVADWGFPHGGPRAFSHGGWGVARSNNSYRTPGGYGRPSGGYTARSQAFARTADRFGYAGNRPAEAHNRSGYQTPGTGYGRSSARPYNSIRPAPSSPQQYGRASYGASSYGRSAESYSSGRGATYRGSRSSYRAPSANFQRSNFGRQPSGKPSHSGGFHPFGGGHGSKSFGGGKGFGEGHGSKSFSGGKGFGGGHGSKSFSGGKSFGRGHSGGGGHGGHSGGKHHR